jgi:hypothetical protein
MARQMDPRRPTHSLATSHFPFLTRSLSEGITMASHRTLAQVIKEFSAISGSQADTNWAGRAAFQLLDTHHIKESAARDALEEALTTFTAASTDTSTPLATNDEQRLRELGETLRARGDMSDRKVRRIEADARTFVADSGNTLSEEFGTPTAYAHRFGSSATRHARTVAYNIGMVALVGVLSLLTHTPIGTSSTFSTVLMGMAIIAVIQLGVSIVRWWKARHHL